MKIIKATKVFILNNCFASQWNNGGLSHKPTYVLLGPEDFNLRKNYRLYQKETGHYALNGFAEHLISNCGFKKVPHKETFFYHGKTDREIM